MNNLIIKLTGQHSVAQLFRYALVGISNTVIGYMIYLTITYLGATPKITMTCLYGISAFIGFFGHRKLSFKHTGNQLSAGGRYFIAHCCGYLINLSLLFLLVDKLGYAHQLAQAFAIIVITFYFFIVYKFYVFVDLDNSSVLKPEILDYKSPTN